MNDKLVETTVIKKDVEVMVLSLKRSKKGLKVSIRLDEILEGLFKEWGGGLVTLPQHGRNWEAFDGPLPQLYALNIMPDAGRPLQTQSGKVYNIARTGTLLMDEQGINLGFLRMKGISGPQGVTFVVKGVYSLEAIRTMAADIREAVKHFFINFVKPVDVVVHMSTQEI